MFKDEYLLDFINTENLGLEVEDIDERVVEQEIVRNMRDFILQFGKDFIFMGNQYRDDYVSKIGYDKFEQRTYLKYCNGAETFYTYDPQRRRLQNLTVNSGGNTIMDNAYTYDAVSNVLSVVNGASVPQSGKAGGQMAHNYTYDALYRLVSATGTYTGADNKTASYTLAMGYDNMHRITSKRQILTQNNVQFDGSLNAGYDLIYTYGTDAGKKFQLANVKDVNYRTEETPSESENVNNNHAYEYDANGNLVYVNTSRTKKDGMADEKTTERKLKWDEENRLLASDDNGFVTNYWYDADGERTVKTSDVRTYSVIKKMGNNMINFDDIHEQEQ